MLAVGNQGMGFQGMFCPLLWVATVAVVDGREGAPRRAAAAAAIVSMQDVHTVSDSPEGGIEAPESLFDSTVDVEPVDTTTDQWYESHLRSRAHKKRKAERAASSDMAKTAAGAKKQKSAGPVKRESARDRRVTGA